MIFTKLLNDFWHIRKIYNFDTHSVFLAIATNIPQRLKTGFVVRPNVRPKAGFLDIKIL